MPIQLNEEDCKPFTAATIRYFDHADTSEARRWLGDASPEAEEPDLTVPATERLRPGRE